MTRSTAVTCLAVGVAIGAAALTIHTKREAARMSPENQPRRPAIAPTAEQADEIIEKLKTRIGLLQATLDKHGLYGDQPVPDDGLQLPGVYPQLIYDRTIGQEIRANTQ